MCVYEEEVPQSKFFLKFFEREPIKKVSQCVTERSGGSLKRRRGTGGRLFLWLIHNPFVLLCVHLWLIEIMAEILQLPMLDGQGTAFVTRTMWVRFPPPALDS